MRRPPRRPRIRNGGLPPRPPSWSARQIVRDLSDRPHLLVRLDLVGGTFPHLDSEGWARVTDGRRSAISWFAEVEEDNSAMHAYFAVDALPAAGVIEYGFGGRVFGRLPSRFDLGVLERLDARKVPKDHVVVDLKFLEALQRRDHRSGGIR